MQPPLGRIAGLSAHAPGGWWRDGKDSRPAVRYPGVATPNQGANTMKVTCPKCGATIDAIITGPGHDRFRWGTNDLPNIIDQCHEWLDPANAEAKARLSCSTMDAAVVDALASTSLRANRP